MKVFYVISASIFLFSSSFVYAQKLKYKDIFPLIQASNWEEATKQLELFIADPKNADEANAHYNLGKSFELKILAAGVLGDTAQTFNQIAAADIHYRRSLSLIDEKELKKNEEYYQEFNRRDLRTGEFGIKVSDVHLDIENKIKALDERREHLKIFLREAAKAQTIYDELSGLVVGFKIDYANQGSFLLAMDKSLGQEFAQVEQLALDFEAAVGATEGALAKIPSAGLKHDIVKKQLNDLAEFDKGSLNLKASGAISYWDIKGWVDKTKAEVNTEVAPFLEKLIAYDRELVATQQELVKDPQGADVPSEVDPTLLGKLREFGANSLAENLITFKVEELNYLKSKHPSLLPDSSQLDPLYKAVVKLTTRLDEMSRLIDISERNANEGFQVNPIFFQSRYVSATQLVEYAKERKSFVEVESSWWKKRETELEQRKMWLIPAGGDSIRLSVVDSVANPANFSALHIADSAGLFVVGLKSEGKDLTFNVAKASGAYTVDWMVKEKLPTPDKGFSFKPKNAGQAPAPEGFHTFFLQYPLGGKTHFFITSIDDAGKLLWKASIDLDHPPVSMSFNKMVMETIIYLEKPEGDPTNNLDYVVIDRTGKVRK